MTARGFGLITLNAILIVAVRAEISITEISSSSI